MTKRLLVLAACLLTLSLAACDSSANPDETSEDGQLTVAPDAPRVTLISATAGADYVIVRSDTTGNHILKKSQELRDAIEEKCGVKVGLKTDWYKDTMGFPPTAREILIGETNRTESTDAIATWRKNGYRDWTVQLVGEKIVIYGGSDEALDEAVAFVIDNCITDGALSMPENMDITYEHAWALDAIKIGERDISEYQIVVPSSAGTLMERAAADFQSFVQENVGVPLEIVADSNQRKQQDYEILIGDTNRDVTPPNMDGATYGQYVYQSGTKLLVGGTSELDAIAAVRKLLSGEAAKKENNTFTIAGDYMKTYDSILDSGVIASYKEIVEERAALGRKAHMNNLMKYADMTEEALLDYDIYGNEALAVLTMPDDEVTPEAIATANRIVRKVTGFMTTDIPTSVKNGNGVDGENDFAANRLCRVLYVDPDRIEPETAEKVKRFFLNDNFQSKYFSENHMLMFRTARYLAACYYEGETFNQYRKTAEEIRKIDYEYLVEFFQFRAKRGWAEFDSMGYGVEDFLSLINLYDCAPDEDIRELARMSMDSLLLSMIGDTTKNAIYGGAHGRNYEVVVNNMVGGIYWIYTLYFGASDFSDVPSAMRSLSSPFVYTSDYRPHDVIYAVVAEKTYPYSNYEVTHNHEMNWTPQEYGFISKYTYNTELYSIGCINRQDPFPRETGYEEHQQTNWSMTFANNSAATLTVHHPGNTGTHRYWCGDSNCYCNHLFGYENVVMGIYYMPGNMGSYNYIHAYVPKAQYSEIVEQPEEGRIFVRLGDAYACLRFSDAYTWHEDDSGKEIVVYDGSAERKINLRFAMACEAGDKDTYGSFEAFIAAMEKKEFVFDRDNLTLTYGNMKQELEFDKSKGISIGVTERNYLDGVLQEYPYKYTYDAPFMKSVFDSGVIEVMCKDATLVMDFMNVKCTVKDN